MPNDERIIAQYRAATTAAATCQREGRALIEVTGSDRATWLNNLVTNVVTTLQPGEGNYAFAVNVKGRVVFDLDMLVLQDRLWLDMDERARPAALSHLERYTVTEDVKLGDITNGHRRIAFIGPAAHEIVDRLALGNLVPMSQLQHVTATIAGIECRLIRHDFVGLPAAEIIAPAADFDAVRSAITAAAGERPLPNIDADTLQLLRIESGIPASVDDIDDGVVPPETGQVERGISYHKGCYLGQEVIERMRSHGVLARRLVGIRVEGEAVVPSGVALTANGQEIGRVTSGCWSEKLQARLALGYAKSGHAKPDTRVSVVCAEGNRNATIVSLPVRS